MNRILRKIEGLEKEGLHKIIIDRYSKVCGNYGRRTFEEKVLPNAFRIFECEPQILVVELFRVIQKAREYKTNKIENYLSNVALEFDSLLENI